MRKIKNNEKKTGKIKKMKKVLEKIAYFLSKLKSSFFIFYTKNKNIGKYLS